MLVISAKRLGIDVGLIKAAGFSRGPKQGHKYVKRELRGYDKRTGKPRYRYWYADDLKRQGAKSGQGVAEEQDEANEHVLMSELKKVFSNLADKLLSALEVSETSMTHALGEQLSEKVDVSVAPNVIQKIHKPFVDKEKAGGDIERSPLARVQRAFELIPEEMRDILAQSPLKTFDILSWDNDKTFGKKSKKPEPGVAGYASKAGHLRLLARLTTDNPHDGTFGSPFVNPESGHSRAEGSAEFGVSYGSAKTWTEEVVWHELAHHVHFALEARNPELIKKWQQVELQESRRISSYANTNWKEDFAETLACALSHPKQLATTCPQRYEWMRKHILKSLPSREDLLDTPSEQLAWWTGKQISNAGKLAAQMGTHQPTSYVDVYQSSKDQFYSMMYRGRQIFMRVGPKDRTEEEGWSEIPPTIDPETGLPVFDKTVSNRFRAKENIKEIYDENGRALSPEQALFWLRQDDEKFASKLPEHLDAYNELAAKDKATHSLSYQMFLALGENRGSQEEERERVKNAREKPQAQLDSLRKKLERLEKKSFGVDADPEELQAHNATLDAMREEIANLEEAIKSGNVDFAALDRHGFAPVPMSRDEFINATPTFKFGDLREDAEQKDFRFTFNQKTKKREYVMALNPVTGKEERVRTATTYSMDNPDGTKTKITVAETDPFSPGQSILVPRTKTVKKKDGTEENVQVWEPYKIPDTHDADPSRLAREFGTTIEELLRQNKRFAKGQITDPLLASLINPDGRQIRSAGDLVGLMRDAARKNASTWITVDSGNPENPSVAHMKVVFDGGGNPIVAGDYWPKKLGLQPGARLDQIIDKRNQVKLEAIKYAKPKKLPAEEGGVVQYRDPKSGRIVLGTIAKITTDEDGKKLYKMKPIAGQGTGLLRRNVNVTEVTTITNDIVPGKPKTRRVFAEAMKSDVLLYLDEVTYESIDAKGRPKGKVVSGVIRIKPPKDGSFSFTELASLPGVRRAPKEPDSDVEELTIDRRDLGVLREALGGFVMDPNVTKLLADLGTEQRKSKRAALTKEVVAPTQIATDDGTVNTGEGGLLRGLRQRTADGKEFKLGSHQVEFLQAVARQKGRMMAAHFMGTGKTVSALAAIQMMRNAKDPDDPTKPAPGSPRKRVAIVVPLNTVSQWESAARFFTEGSATVIGSQTLTNSVQAFKWPARKPNESEGDYNARVARERAAHLKENPAAWDPSTDPNDTVIIPFEYFRDNEADLRAFGDFDGIIVDEAHAVAKENELSRAVERWNPTMNMMLLLTGTPVTNRLDTLPRLLDLLSNGQKPLGSIEEFKERYMTASQVMIAQGAKNPPKTDINPQNAAELGAILQRYMHVAMTEDVRGKTMPAVMLDENQPAHMIGVQEKLYRAAMAALTEEDREALEQSASLGLDEESMLSPKARAKVQVARNFANSPGYKAPDSQEYKTYEETVVEKKGGKSKEKTVKQIFQFPEHAIITQKKPSGWGGKWPSVSDVGRTMSESYFSILSETLTQYLGRDYEAEFAGKPIDPKHLAQIKAGALNGFQWGKVANPDYGPEGAICRGSFDAGELRPLRVEYDGEWIDVPVGTKFIRDPNKKAAGVYYHADDWDFSGAVNDDVEGGDEGEGEDDSDGGKERKKAGSQKPKKGMEDADVTRSPKRRRERAMFDATMTHGNAKCDELERYMVERRNTKTGGDKSKQFILFGNRVGSSCRTMEAKMRQMGYQDINEALGADSTGYSSNDDRARRPTQGYYVTYFGKNASTGDRDINSEIFRKVKDEKGLDTDVSMFVHRTLTGSVGTPPKEGEFKEGWSPAERKRISKLFHGPDGEPNIEIPMRVTSQGGKLMYVYESDIRDAKGGAAALKTLRDLDLKMRGAKLEDKPAIEAQMNAIYAKYVTDRKPLSQHQMDVFNNCKVMVASDAAQVGLNWGNASELVMYDSLHSPMLEWQRITRAARMLDAIIPDKAKPHMSKIDAYIKKREAETGFAEYGNLESSMAIVKEAYENALTQDEQREMNDLKYGPVASAEAYFANRAFEKIAQLRQPVRDKLRTVGRELEPVEVKNEETGEIEMRPRFIDPKAITNADVMNEILEKHLTPFEREILKSRKYLVNVKRLTTSVSMPEFKIVKDEDGKKKRVATGNYYTEVPSRAEQSTLMQGRAKQVPYEYMLKMMQDKHEVKTEYDFLPVNPSSLGRLSVLPDEPVQPAPAPVQKSLVIQRGLR